MPDPLASSPDPLAGVPSPEVVRHLIAEATRRRDLLKALLKLALYQSAYPPAGRPGGDPGPRRGRVTTAGRRAATRRPAHV